MKLLFFLLSTGGSLASFENCDYYKELFIGDRYYISSPKYPRPYLPGQSCRWYAVSPPGTRIILTCDKFSVTQSQGCNIDRFTISTKGSDDFSDANSYCGTGSFSTISTTNKIGIALLTSSNSNGGSFVCSIGVENSIEVANSQFDQERCECGWKNVVRIVGGHDTAVNEFPMMAALIDGRNRELFCGATIISSNFAITAAHCLFGKKAALKALLVGDHNVNTGNETNSAALYLVDKFILHPQYNSVSQENDIALIRVQRPIQFNRNVGPVCLPFSNVHQNFEGESVEAVGWGTMNFGGLNSMTLQKVDLDVVNIDKCISAFGKIVSDKQLCTFKEGKDACQSDSGGPIFWKDSTSDELRVKLIGIVSYGIGCATEKPSVNTGIVKFLPWIKENTNEQFCLN